MTTSAPIESALRLFERRLAELEDSCWRKPPGLERPRALGLGPPRRGFC